MAPNCRHWRQPEWACIHDLEDVMAVLAEIDSRRIIIKRHAWREGSWSQVYDEAEAMHGDIDKLRNQLSELWKKWITDATTEAGT